MHTVYAIKDSRGAVRYVGATEKALKVRLATHISIAASHIAGTATRDISAARRAFLEWLLQEDVTIEPIEQCESSVAYAREKFWIAEHRRLGASLFNLVVGGSRGSLGYKHDDAMKQKLSDLMRGNQRRLGHTNSPEHRAKIAASKRGKPRDEATKQKLREAQTGKEHTLATRAKVARAARERWASMTPEQRRERALNAWAVRRSKASTRDT